MCIRDSHTTGLSWNTGGGAQASGSGGAVSSTGGSGAETDFVNLVADNLNLYYTISEKLGGPVADQAKLFKEAVEKEKQLIAKAATTKKPSQQELAGLLAPISEIMGKITEIKEKNRGHKHFNHLNAVAEGTPALGWVSVEPTPAPFVSETIGSSEFWSNKILKDFKGKDEEQVNWVKGFNGFLKGLVPYIKRYHTTGLAWSTGAASGGSITSGSAPIVGSSGSEKEFSNLIADHLNSYYVISEKLGGPVAEQAKLFKQAVDKELELISKATKTKKPSPQELQTLLAPISDVMGKITEIKDKNRGNKYFNNLSTVAEGTPALGWVSVEPTPGPFVSETIGSSEFWSNKILKDFKGKDEEQVNWVKGFNGFLKGLVPYIKQYHTTGLSWSK
eukprot:TRINITY_DN673_c0_g1_i1.p1 TRINITY_DN673_c0_g1~~TRINITY_DN673_c0_g1_i1.p1  ORF type:complete len:390 (+),score=94.41 TRINITY_DN673_c0_g1_i1:2-1171(+)